MALQECQTCHPLTKGMLYSVPMIAIGIYFIYRARAGATSENPERAV